MKCPVTESRSLDQGRFMETKHLIMERGGEQQKKNPQPICLGLQSSVEALWLDQF